MPSTPEALRIAAIFHRKALTPWTDKEVRAFKALREISISDLEAVEAYYAANWPPCRDKNILRHDLVTFLNNFRGEVDRARVAGTPAQAAAAKNFFSGTPFATT
ncbi:MAG: hypothetical protein V4672_13080 [Verrucomicrobiota bacterium]